jgi:hypothetical protein
MKVCWADGKKAGYILGDGGFKTLTILPDIALNDYGIFITEGGKEDAIKQAITQLSQAALQSGNIDLLNVIKVLKAETLTEAEHILENGISEMKKQAQASQQAQMQAQQAAAQEAMAQREHDVQMKQMEIDGKIAAAEKINEGKVKVANIQADVEADINSDKIEYQTKKDMYATDTNKELEQAKMDMQTKQSDRDRQAANKVKK